MACSTAGDFEHGRLGLHPPGLDLRQVEDVVDEAEVLSGALDVVDVFGLLAVSRRTS
jgi:hypothetical protein